MNDTKLYEQILGLQAPWSVQSVTLKQAEGIIEIEVGWGRAFQHPAGGGDEDRPGVEGQGDAPLVLGLRRSGGSDRFKRDMLFHLGGLDLHPEIAQ